MRAEEMSDPHDDLLLTERPTTIITQNTMAHDSMPSPYGTQEDEEALFSDVGNDYGLAANDAAVANATASTQDRVPAVVRDGPVVTVAPDATTAAATNAGKQMLAVIAIGLGVGWLMARR